HRCKYCLKPLPTRDAVARHISHSPSCLKDLETEYRPRQTSTSWWKHQRGASESNDVDPFLAQDDAAFTPDECSIGAENQSRRPPTCDDRPRAKRARVEDMGDSKDMGTDRWAEPFPGKAGIAEGKGKTDFEAWKEVLEWGECGAWAPFKDDDEWELAQWLVENVGKNKIDEYLKLNITQRRTEPSFHNSYSFFKAIDELPTGPQWTCEIITVKGNRQEGDGMPIKEELKLWRRNPVECVAELLGNPAFQENIAYAPERVFSDRDGCRRIYDEMWTGD
ncbi:hypothetical protein NEOLEDRAFT_1028379, partial [Neolentinus lepideus HHB14362 ss-1]